ncbi:MAG: glycosyltransferase [Bacteroidales bacterium]|nr:glycosyltransferase [Bacteroidales bacterium]
MLTTIVIPCYNESKRLKINEFLDFSNTHTDIQFLFVNDGSKDNTLEVLQNLSVQHEHIHYLDVQPNGGKAEAVRKGMIYAAENLTTDLIGFWDADLATPLSEIDNFIFQMQRADFDIVTGLRLMRLGAGVKRQKLRHYLGRCFATTASIALQLPVYDTQCRAKLYKTSVVPTLFKESFITRWLFDVELLARYKKAFGIEQTIQKINIRIPSPGVGRCYWLSSQRQRFLQSPLRVA